MNESRLVCRRCGGPALRPDQVVAIPEDVDRPADDEPYCVNRCWSPG